MFKVGDYIVYGARGVCKVVDVGCVDLSGISKDRIYYTLESIHTQGGKIYTPTDNDKTIIRSVIDKEEGMELLDEIESIEAIWVEDDRKRESNYKEAIRMCDCRELIKIIKTTLIRKKERAEVGKKVTAGDEKYLQIAEENLYSEMAIALGINVDQAEQFVVDKLK